MSTSQDSIDANEGQDPSSPAGARSPVHANYGPRLRALVVAAGIASGLLAWLAGEACLDVIKPVSREVLSKSVMLRLSNRRQVAAAGAWNAGLAFVILGSTLGAAMGAAGGLARGSRLAARRAALVGLALGAGGAVAISAVILPAYNMYKDQHPDEAYGDLLFPLLVHAAIWATAGGAAGAALAVGLGERTSLGRLVIGGVLGAMVAAVVYEIVGAILFPSAKTAQFVSETWQTRLLARSIVAFFAAIGIMLSLNERRTAKQLASDRPH